MTPKKGDLALELVDEGASPQQRTDEVSVPGGPEGDFDIHEFLDGLVEGRWILAIATAAALLLAVGYVLLAPPVYRIDAIIQVEDKKAAQGLLGDFAAVLGETSLADTEIELLRSRALLGEVVRELKLEIEAKPRRIPLLGQAIARARDPADGVAGPVLGIRRYGWGGERIRVDRLEVPEALVAERLTLVSGDADSYTLRGPDGNELVSGTVGTLAAANGVEIFVSELVGRPGLEFRLVRRSTEDVLADLQDDIRITEKGKKTGIVQLVLDGREPVLTAALVNSLARAYVRQNVERGSEEARKALEFLQEQLPTLREKLEKAEAELERYRARTGSIDVTLEAQAAVGRIVDIEKAMSELQVEFAALRGKFTPDHPALIAIRQRLQRLEQERASFDTRLKKLPVAELESVRRIRDVKVANELYLALVNKMQELRIMKEGTIGNVRIVDQAIVPAKPVWPKPIIVLVLGLLTGVLGGIAIVFARRALDHGVEDPDALERALGIAVHASIPHSALQEGSSRDAARGGREVALLANDEPKDLAVEALRSLRTSLQFALVDGRKAVVAVSGPAPGVGKSFVTANLAHLLGDAGKRVVVVDADLRRGQLHRYYGGDRRGGLSDVIAGNMALSNALRPTSSPGVRFISTGTIPPNPAELLGSERFTRLLAELEAQHDLVLVDTPPVLAVTDATLVARNAGVTLLVARAGAHPLREIAAAARAFRRAGAPVNGLVLNAVRLDRGLGRRNAYHYQYRYE